MTSMHFKYVLGGIYIQDSIFGNRYYFTVSTKYYRTRIMGVGISNSSQIIFTSWAWGLIYLNRASGGCWILALER